MLAALVAVGLTSLAVGTIGAQSVLDKSLRQATDSSRDLADKLNDVEDSTTSLSRYAGSISELSEFVQCDDSDLEDFLGEMADSFQEAAQEAAGSIEDTGKEADKWADRVAIGRRRLNLALLLVVAVVHVALMPSTAYGTALSRRWSLWVASRFAFLICCFLALAVAAEFAVGVELADFCRKPDQHFADVVRERGGNLGEEAQDLMIYYSTCEGENPLEDELAAALVAANSLSDTIDSLKATCEPTAVIDRIQFEVEASIQIIENDLTQQIQCAPINRDYQRVLHTATCRHSLRGLYFLAIVHAFVLAALYVFLYATNWVCETILLEEEFWLLPHPEIFTVASYRSNRAAPLTSVSSNDDDDDDDANDIDLEFENTRAVREVRI